jgi:hypothetical protein
MGNKIYKECIEDKNQDIVKKFNDKIKKLRSPNFEEINKSEYNTLLENQHVLIDDSVDSLIDTFKNDKKKLCALLSKTKCLVKKNTGPQIKYFKSCLEKTENETHIEDKYTINDSYFPSNFKSRVRSTKKSGQKKIKRKSKENQKKRIIKERKNF